eukprot:TRINITY_DN57283_c0_g1_i1.p1 TRINITY_DN57283_c0_g1~~TRINITY_DN57283_c0_g1_i1.p1  ORF type:complete len:198 (+),score=62.03 TRINITY_DN57283_c0_g1_i1:34-594(+)
MAVDILAMQENLRWEGVAAEAHLEEIRKFDEFNYWISEYFDTPAPAHNVLDGLAVLMGWPGDAKQIVTKMTGQRHTEDKKHADKFATFCELLKECSPSKLPEADQMLFKQKLTESVEWQKYDHESEHYLERTAMNSYDVLKCSQACFHLFEWMRSLLTEEEQPPRFLDVDIKAFREREKELQAADL